MAFVNYAKRKSIGSEDTSVACTVFIQYPADGTTRSRHLYAGQGVVLPEENDRTLLSLPNAVQFQNANIAAADKDLISFICENTGKIRPLAISDLDSYLNLGTEMLNIGKPFHLEGIGTITKNKSGKFDFTPGRIFPDQGKYGCLRSR